jgi:hypothetical protein
MNVLTLRQFIGPAFYWFRHFISFPWAKPANPANVKARQKRVGYDKPLKTLSLTNLTNLTNLFCQNLIAGKSMMLFLQNPHPKTYIRFSGILILGWMVGLGWI